MAKKAKTTQKGNLQFEQVFDKVKGGTKELQNSAEEINNFTLKTTEDVLDVALASGEKWQAVSEKAIKGSLDLAAKNNDLVFDLLGTAKEQLQANTKRIKNLVFSKN